MRHQRDQTSSSRRRDTAVHELESQNPASTPVNAPLGRSTFPIISLNTLPGDPTKREPLSAFLLFCQTCASAPPPGKNMTEFRASYASRSSTSRSRRRRVHDLHHNGSYGSNLQPEQLSAHRYGQPTFCLPLTRHPMAAAIVFSVLRYVHAIHLHLSRRELRRL